MKRLKPRTIPSGAPMSDRRTFLLRGACCSTPYCSALLRDAGLGYLLAPLRRGTFLQMDFARTCPEAFPENQTRLAVYRNPFRKPWDGGTADIPCWVGVILRAIHFKYSRLTVRIWAARCDGFPSRSFSCAHVTAAPSMRMVRERRDRRRAGFMNIHIKWRTANCGLKPARCRS